MQDGTKSTNHTEKDIANQSDFETVSILFAEPQITCLFSELLKAKGVDTKILNSPQEILHSGKLITEPQYIGQIDPSHHKRCLLVGNKEVLKGLNTLSLTRPLTEEKVEKALSLLLGS